MRPENMFGSLLDRLQAHGYEVKEGNHSRLVKVHRRGALMCVDGRKGDQSREVMSGPKIQGGLYGVMALLGLRDDEGIDRAIEIVHRAGFIPGLHLDDKHNDLGCGFGRLWLQRMFGGIAPPEVMLDQIIKRVQEAGGVIATLRGSHAEKIIRINTVPEMTLIPDGGAFNLDLWVAGSLGLPTEKLAENALLTVKLLNGPNKIELY